MKKLLFLLALFSVMGPKTAAAVESPKNPNSAKACAICHYRWIDTFFVEGRGSDLVAYSSEKVVATPQMCLSCHDGSVIDSRAKLIQRGGHKTGTRPPQGMKIPELFPLDEAGRVNCATCHTAHGVPSGTDSSETIFLRASNKNSALCRQCHPEKGGGTSTGNHPLEAANKPVPAVLTSAGARIDKESRRFICQSCHVAHGSSHESLLADSAGDSRLCLDCHPDKDALGPDGARKPYHAVNVVPQRAQIPPWLLKNGAKLGYQGVITCQTCHKVHNNGQAPQLLLIKKDTKSTLCLTCHAGKTHLQASKHNLMNSAPAEKNLEGQTAQEAGICSACHLPHKAARELSDPGDLTTRLCRSCDQPGAVAAKVLIAGDSHPVDVNPFEKIEALADAKAPLSLPVFNRRGAPDVRGNMTCATCHDPHGPEAGTAASAGHGKPDNLAPAFLLRKASKDLCQDCHRDKAMMAGSRHDLGKVAPQAKNVLEQTPAESGLCGSCHLVHQGRGAFLWGRQVAASSRNLAQDLCVSCHRPDGLAAAKSIGSYSHPLDVTPQRKGLTTTLPLFDRHGRRASGGSITCVTCHDPHRWDPLTRMAGGDDNVQGNARNSFLRRPAAPYPQLCRDCHPAKAYMENTDHDLRVTAPDVRNSAGQIPAESGICGACHLTHNSQNWARLWARDFGAGESLMDMMCNSCHSSKGPAAAKTPPVGTHPAGRPVNNAAHSTKGRIDFFPLFHHNYAEPVNLGDISCPSCHNAHQWDPAAHTTGSGVNLEGNATNSFLRSPSSIRPCKDCHGADALFRYKFFHKAEARQAPNRLPPAKNGYKF